jgi:ABC-type branched-subunit amino acid transport system ATPase component
MTGVAAEKDDVLLGVFHVSEGQRLFDYLTVTENAEVKKAYLGG